MLAIQFGFTQFSSCFRECSRNVNTLKKIGITHVLNTADGDAPGMVDTGFRFYKDSGIHYQGFTLSDMPTTNISVYFKAGADFIDKALSSGGESKFILNM